MTLNENFAAFGFFVVPAFDGVIEAVPVTTGAGFWASATAAGTAPATSTATPIRSLRKVASPPPHKGTDQDARHGRAAIGPLTRASPRSCGL